MIINTTNGFNMIEVNSRPDCQDFSGLYDRLQGTHLLNPSKSEVKKLLTTHPERPLILSGHGDDNGLYNHLWNGYLISSKDVELLRKQQVIIGVWCYAGNFADRYGLKGFFTSMFISTENEAVELGFTATQEEISRASRLFANRLNNCMREQPCISEWGDILRDKAGITKGFVGYNYEALAYFDGE